MIVGETETLLARATGDDFHHDNFLFFGKKKKKKQTPEEKEVRRTRRRKFWNDLEQTLQTEGLDESVNNLVGAFKKKSPGSEEASDYEVGLQGQNENDKDKKGISTGTYVVGGAVIVGLVVYVISTIHKHKQLKISSGQ